jgi:hypothetical protein
MRLRTLAALPALACATALSAGAQRLDIVDFGARCNGGDDSAAVQSALNALPDGGTLAVSCQAGIGSKGITLQGKNGVIIQGVNGGGFKALASTSQGIRSFSSVMFVVRSCVSCTVQNLMIDGANAGVSALGFEQCSAANVLNNSITNAGPPPGSAAITAAGNQHNRYIGNTIVHTDGTGPGGDGTRGIWLGNADEQTTEWYPYVAGNTIRDTAHTGLVLQAVAAVATGNLIEGMGDGAGIKAVPAPGKPGVTYIVRNKIRNGRAVNQGIQLQDAYSDGLIIQGNILSGLADSGIYGNGGNVQVIGNTFTDNTTAGITILEGDGWLIRDSTFSHDSANSALPGAGIRLTAMSGSIQNVRIVSNMIRQNLHGGVQIYDGGGTISGVTITNNTIIEGSSYGVLIDEHTANAINGVEVLSNCFAGNATASLRDNRSGGRAIKAVSGSLFCPSPPPARKSLGAELRRVPVRGS